MPVLLPGASPTSDQSPNESKLSYFKPREGLANAPLKRSRSLIVCLFFGGTQPENGEVRSPPQIEELGLGRAWVLHLGYEMFLGTCY